MKVTLTNTFHNTEVTIDPIQIKEGRFAGYHKVSRATMMRARRTLCGRSGCCQCGGIFSERCGAYLKVINEDCDRNLIIDMKASHV